MKKTAMIETLEQRKLLSAAVTTTINATAGSTPAAAAKLTLGPNTLFFNAVTQSNSSSSSGGPHTSSYDLRTQNTGTGRLVINSIKVRGTDQGDFVVSGFPVGGQSFAAGKAINYSVTFTADSTPGIKTAFLIVTSTAGTFRVPMRALVTKGEGTTFEPSLQDIFNLYNFQINAGENVRTSDPYFVASTTSDEVNIGALQKADASKSVIVRPLAEFTNHATPAVRMGFYTPGNLDSTKYLWYSPSESSQSVTPLVYGQSTFDPGTGAFGLATQYPYFTNPDGTTTNVYSENALNKKLAFSASSSLVHMKFYPYKDASGTTVANTYIVAEEEYGDDSVSDSQDLVFIVTNVKSAVDKPTVAVQNLTGFPSNDIASFNVVQNDDQYVPNIVRRNNTIRVLNSGTQPLVATFGVSGDYSLSNGGSNITIAPGAYRDLTVTFNATSGTEVHQGTLTITSNDTANPTKTVALLGNWQLYSEQMGPGQPSLEPSAQKIVNDLLGYQTILQYPNQTLAGPNGIGSTRTYVGQEISAEYFQTADTNAPANVTQLATFHNQTYVDSNTMMNVGTNSFIGWYYKGSPDSVNNYTLQDNVGQGQEILGPGTNSNGSVAHGKVKASGTQQFGFVVEHGNTTTKRGEYSDHTLNPEATGQSSSAQANFGGVFLRFFTAYDEHGVLIPNTYIMLHDYNKETTNYDFQDNVYLITNIIPAGAMKGPRTVYAQKTSAGALVNFTSPDDGPKVLGFNVYRSATANGTFTKLNTSLLPRRPSGSFTDTAAGSTLYYYAVTTVGANGVESQRYIVQESA